MGWPLIVIAALSLFFSPTLSSPSFTIVGDNFVKDGISFTFMSAEIHYSRVHPEDWSTRLRALKLAGYNSVTTYTVWNAHEIRPNEFYFSGSSNLTRWFDAIAEAGLLCILRVGPYVTAELDNGGLPFWLATTPGLVFRTNNSQYLNLVDNWFDRLVPLLLPYQYSQGGPIVSIQLEDDTDTHINPALTQAYYSHLVSAMRARGVDTLLSTLCGFYSPNQCAHAAVPGVWVALEFGVNDENPATVCSLPAFRNFYPSGPCVVMETYTAWFDYVGGKHAPIQSDYGPWIDSLLTANASISTYMAHGGTNFGFIGGADENGGGKYSQITTSYDYSAPLSEAGDPTPLYSTLQAVFFKHGSGVKPGTLPPSPPRTPYPPVHVESCASLFQAVSSSRDPPLFNTSTSASPVSMEGLGQGFGYILYSLPIKTSDLANSSLLLHFSKLQDRAVVFLDGVLGGVVGWGEADPSLSLTLPLPSSKTGWSNLTILVQNTGRCSGELVDSRCALKGILGEVSLSGRSYTPAPPGTQWLHTLLPFDNVMGISQLLPWLPAPVCASMNTTQAGPTFWRATLTIPPQSPPNATYLSLVGWGVGFATVNGFNIGRFSCRGPQGALYVPQSVLQPGDNDILLFESDYAPCSGCLKESLRDGQIEGGRRFVTFQQNQTWWA